MQHSDEFVKSQYIYYGRVLNSGNHSDRMMLTGLYHVFEAEMLRRGFIRFDRIRGAYVTALKPV